jgi:serine protease Do
MYKGGNKMKKITKFLMIILMAVVIGGCSCSNEECACPNEEQNTTEQTYTTINSGYKDLYSQTVESVVMVRVQRKSNGEIKATGSGVVAYQEGDYAYIFTNAHVIKDVTSDFEIEVFFSDNEGFLSGKSEIATIKGKDFNEDVAVLRINKSTKYKLATIGDSSKVNKGDFVYTIGSPYQKFNHTTSGTISNYNVKIDIDMLHSGVTTPIYAILFDAPINNGNSGGALFNAEGKLIGITTLKYDDLEGIYGALPINYFMKVARHLFTNNSYNRPSLNLTLLSINEMGVLRQNYGISNSVTTGVYVQNSLEINIANQSVITEVNGIKVISNAEFQVELLKYSIGDRITLTLMNKDGLNIRQVSVTLR